MSTFKARETPRAVTSLILGVVAGVGAFLLLGLTAMNGDPESTANVGLLEAGLLSLGGGFAGLVHHRTRGFAERGPVRDYLRWGLVIASGMLWLGFADLLRTGEFAPVIGTAAIGFAGGLGLRVTIRFLSDSQN